MTMIQPRVLVFGCGYVGRSVARHAAAAGQSVVATTRSAAKCRQIQSTLCPAVRADWNDARSLTRLPPVDRVLVSVSYDPSGGADRYESQVGGLQRLLSVLPPQTAVVYLSTTGVYHQDDGSWVDERSPARPRRSGGIAHLAAEEVLRRWGGDRRWTILRLAGIYGPGRVPRARDVVAGNPIASPAEGHLNLIHLDDITRVVMAAWERLETLAWDGDAIRHAAKLYVVADDRPMIRRDFYREIARQTRSPEPRFDPAMSQTDRSKRSDSNKRIWNRLMKRDLCPRLLFPTYREGLADVLHRSSRGPISKTNQNA